MNYIIEHANKEMKKLYNEEIFNFEIDKEIKFLNGNYCNILDKKQKKILQTVEILIIDKILMAVTTYHGLLLSFLTDSKKRRPIKNLKYIDELIKTLSDVKGTAKYLFNLIDDY